MNVEEIFNLFSASFQFDIVHFLRNAINMHLFMSIIRRISEMKLKMQYEEAVGRRKICTEDI